MAGATISPSNAQRIIDAGLNITGQLRVITDAAVARHNAPGASSTAAPSRSIRLGRALRPGPAADAHHSPALEIHRRTKRQAGMVIARREAPRQSSTLGSPRRLTAARDDVLA